eukprot:SAG31_NODE_24170_length_487_cov_1.435567_1_plen_88_part_00
MLVLGDERRLIYPLELHTLLVILPAIWQRESGTTNVSPPSRRIEQLITTVCRRLGTVLSHQAVGGSSNGQQQDQDPLLGLLVKRRSP